jgi:hypothetical protein
MTATAAKARRTLKAVREGGMLKVIVTEGRSVKAYSVDPSRDGLVWWNASEQKTYDVTCSDGRAVACTCKGFGYRGRCRHTDASNKLDELGMADLGGPPAGWCVSTETE